VDRWRRIAREAARQSGRSRVPAVGDPVPLADAIRALPEGRRIVLFEEERTDRLSNLAAHPTIVLAIGPEGGWTSGEIERLEGAGFEPSGLSDGILRAETAALAAVSVVRTLSLKGGAWGA
jgi:16S rRNA (uracil1498-N3)-methyltransferase